MAVTFIAEGGAVLLREQQENLENIHPVYGIGADYLSQVSEQNGDRRARLSVLPPDRSIAGLLASGDYPEQPTSWNAEYHILQRYGAYTALKRFTDVFDERDMFVGADSSATTDGEQLPPQPQAPDRGARLKFRGR